MGGTLFSWQNRAPEHYDVDLTLDLSFRLEIEGQKKVYLRLHGTYRSYQSLDGTAYHSSYSFIALSIEFWVVHHAVYSHWFMHLDL